jgi:drug/metabolite transporter, DME family
MSRLLVLLAAICFATTGTAQALGAGQASPVAVGAVRIALGALGLHLAAAAGAAAGVGGAGPVGARGAAGRREGRWGPPALLPRTRTMWLAAAGVAAYQVTFFVAVRTTGVAVGTVVALGSAPVLTGLVGWAAGQGRPGRRWAAATVLAVVGLGILALAAGSATPVSPVGVLLALGAGASYALYTVGTKQALTGGDGAERTMASLFTGGALMLAPALVLLDVRWVATPRGLAASVWLGLVPTALAYVLFARGLRGLSAAEVSTLTLAEPLTATALGVLVLGESLPGRALVGAGLLMLGLVVLAAPAASIRTAIRTAIGAARPAVSR